ncbi:YraN family protein [Microbacterium sediminicola]|uniref:UPF0102 protein GCM10009808_05550 n=1 Tax=Microbacterium sediminicola TaxID=415210 RepID=A0ABN2HPU7_9MICO
MASKDELGRSGERRAEAHLRACGYEIIDRNWRCRRGEIDLVARDRDWVVFVEVKTRSGERFGHPFEAIDVRKRRRLRAIAHEWVQVRGAAVGRRSIRIDAIAITELPGGSSRIEHLPDIS